MDLLGIHLLAIRPTTLDRRQVGFDANAMLIVHGKTSVHSALLVRARLLPQTLAAVCSKFRASGSVCNFRSRVSHDTAVQTEVGIQVNGTIRRRCGLRTRAVPSLSLPIQDHDIPRQRRTSEARKWQFSKSRGAEYRSQNTLIRIMGTPSKVHPIWETPKSPSQASASTQVLEHCDPIPN